MAGKKRFEFLRDPDFWSTAGLFALPLAVVGLLFVIAGPQLSEEYNKIARGGRPRTPARVVIPDALAPEVLPRLASIKSKELEQAVEEMAAEMEAVARDAEVQVVTGIVTRASVAPPPRPALPVPTFRTLVTAEGLKSPDGVAIDPRTGALYVADEAANRIVMINRRGRVRTVIDTTTRLVDSSRGSPRRIAAIRNPEGLAMDGKGHLYVVEDRPGGRVIAIQMDEQGKPGAVEIISVPGNNTNIQWESIAVRDTGELLLAGSSAESAGSGGFFSGALVYRDLQGRWWVPVMRPMAGFSSIAFSKDGSFAIYTDEVNGTLGWIDLRARHLREGASRMTFQSPEGVCVLPDGRIVVAEEKGRLSLVDPEADRVDVIAEKLGPIESVAWDGAGGRLVVTSDGQGKVLQFIPDAAFPTHLDRMQRAVCQSEGAIRKVPPAAPDFLRPLLDLGGFSDAHLDDALAFDELTRRVPMLAADSRAILIHSRDDVVDPIMHVRFVALDPNSLRFDEPGYEFALSAVLLRTQSGQIYKTQISRTVVLSGNLWVGQFKNHGVFDVPVPFAYHAQPGPRGHAVIHFTGLGRSPDLSIALDPNNPDDSYMLVTHVNGSLEQYRLVTTRSESGSENWVISLPGRQPISWIQISGTPAEPTSAEQRL